MTTKDIRRAAESAQSSKLRKLGAQGSLAAARHGENAVRKYATGGSVNPSISGGPAKPKGRGSKGKKKGDTNIHIAMVNPSTGGAAGPGGPMPMLGGPPGPPGGLGGPGPMPGGPGPGGPAGGPGGMPPKPPMLPGRAFGGRIKPKEEGGKDADLAKDKKMAKPFQKGGKC